MIDEAVGEAASELEKLCGCPEADDILMYAVPMCGPYTSLLNFKYKIKLTPGTVKKGKCAKQAIDLFTKLRECSDAEKPLIKALTDPEMVAIMICDVKLSMPGLQAIKRQEKSKNKSNS